MTKDPDILVDLTNARNDFEAQIIVESLQSQGIPARAFTTAGSTLQWEVAASQPYRVAVRRADLDRAQAALKAIRADSVDLDWDEVDTGDRSPVSEAERQAATPLPGEPHRRMRKGPLAWIVPIGLALLVLLLFWRLLLAAVLKLLS